MALDVTTVDYLSLDVEGNEMDILATIPFNKLRIQVYHLIFNFHKGS